MKKWSSVGVRALSLVVVICAIDERAIAADVHMSLLNLVRDNGALVEGDVDGARGLIGQVGMPVQAHVKVQIGWFVKPERAGPFTLVRSDISNPEFALFSPDQELSALPVGVTFDAATGVFAGTPSVSGSWVFRLSVRDSNHGESPYLGDGLWWTETTSIGGKTWIQDKGLTAIAVLPAPSGKEILLQCGGKTTVTRYNQTVPQDLQLEIDVERGRVRAIGDDGKTAGIYRATVNEEFITWGNTNMTHPDFNATGVKIDRKTGVISSIGSDNTFNGNCTKRSAEQKF